MKTTEKPSLFNGKNIRTYWASEEDELYLSIIDIITSLTDTGRPRKYWSDLKKKLADEGSQLSDNIGQLKMIASDGKLRTTDVVTIKQAFRLIQSIPSKRAEPFKIWLAQVGNERVNEIQDPELILNMLAENTATEISKNRKPQGFIESQTIAVSGAKVSRRTREDIEKQTGKSVIVSASAKDLGRLDEPRKKSKHMLK